MILGTIILVKMVVMGLFSSDYQDQMFIPFVKTFLSGVNPYEYYYHNGLPSSFPYFPYMLLVETVAGGGYTFFLLSAYFGKIFCLKFHCSPLIFWDFLS